jgi:hypothetical protein
MSVSFFSRAAFTQASDFFLELSAIPPQRNLR